MATVGMAFVNDQNKLLLVRSIVVLITVVILYVSSMNTMDFVVIVLLVHAVMDIVISTKMKLFASIAIIITVETMFVI